MEYISAVVHGFVAHSIATPLLGSLCQTPTHDDGTLVSANITSPVLSPETQKNFLKSKLFPGKTPNNSTSSGHTNLRVLPASERALCIKTGVCACAPAKLHTHTPSSSVQPRYSIAEETQQPGHHPEEELGRDRETPAASPFRVGLSDAFFPAPIFHPRNKESNS